MTLTLRFKNQPLRDPSPLAIRIKSLLEHLGMTEAELSRRSQVKQQVCNQVLRGQTINPRMDTLIQFASVLGVTVGQLVGTESLVAPPPRPASHLIPLLAWEDVLPWVDREKLPSSSFHSIPWISCDLAPQSRGYAIRSNASLEPFFDQNSILIVSPSEVYLPGQFVVVSADAKAISVRRLVEDLGVRFLRPVVAGAPTIELEKKHRLLGTLIEVRMNLEGL